MRRFWVATAVAVLVWPGVAAGHARPHAAREVTPVNYMRQLAPKFWGAQACGGWYTVNVIQKSGRDVVGGLSWWTFLNADPGDTARWTGCGMTITIYTTVMDAWPALDHWPSFCSAFLHEFGHLTGHEHSTDPTDVMYPVLQTSAIPPICAHSPNGWFYSQTGGYTGHR